jgi:hypothetical protein
MATARKSSTKPAPKRKAGRPSPYLVGYAADFPTAAKKLALLGATDVQMADFFGIAESTLSLWKNKHLEFRRALTEGKMIADASVVDALYQRACGFEHDEEVFHVVAGEVVRTKTKKKYAPDPASMIFWLKNRQKDKWRDKVETGVTDNEGKDVPPTDPMEGARRIAFALAKAAETLKD